MSEDNNNFDKLFGDFFAKNLLSFRSEFLHPYAGLKLKAYLSTLNYIEQNMLENVSVCLDQNEIFNYAIKNLNKDGIIAEFGVKTGKSINNLAQKVKKRKIYGFDSFAGLPENWTGTRSKKGNLSAQGVFPKVSKQIELVPGWFKDSLPEFKKTHKDDFALIHIDCDLYSSTKDVFNNIAKQIKPGSLIIFDEYFNYPNWQNHEYKAFQEFIKNNKLKYKYLAYATTQVLVEIT